MDCPPRCMDRPSSLFLWFFRQVVLPCRYTLHHPHICPLFLEETFLHTLVIYICFHVYVLYSHSKANHPLPMTRGTVIHFPSSDGMSRSGVFITCMSEIERVNVEGGVDIFQTVKAARAQRPHMVYTSVSYY